MIKKNDVVALKSSTNIALGVVTAVQTSGKFNGIDVKPSDPIVFVVNAREKILRYPASLLVIIR